MGGYAVDPAELENAAASLQSAVGGSRSALSPLRVSANRLLTSRWQGAAAAAYRLGWEQWLEGVEAMLAALDELALALRQLGERLRGDRRGGTDERRRGDVVSRLVVDLAHLAELIDRMEQYLAHLSAVRDEAVGVSRLHPTWTGAAARPKLTRTLAGRQRRPRCRNRWPRCAPSRPPLGATTTRPCWRTVGCGRCEHRAHRARDGRLRPRPRARCTAMSATRPRAPSSS